MFAITGTNGKTSTVHFGALLCSLMGEKSATIGTNGICVYENGVIISQEKMGLTTPTCVQNHLAIFRLQKNGVKFIFMEASSIGIEQGRIDGIEFDASCFSNFTQDHLDYHHTMEEYFKQKLRLFTEFTKKDGLCILNSSDVRSQEIAQFCKSVVFFGENDNVLKSCTQNSDDFLLNFGEIHAQFNASGNFQVLNLSSVVHSLLFFGFKLEQIALQIPKLSAPEGRMEMVKIGQKTFVIDYAHTPDALENVLKNIAGNKICVFGCGGNRDSAKRKIMGEIASKYSNFVIITNDNPRFENPQEIADEIFSGIAQSFFDNCKIILDRKEAILFAEKICKNGETVVIAGKGSEDYQEINGTKFLFSDVEIVKSLVK
jgi:UDP-N-acetylmuramoyl-L-alanyl-D-glutamate--2,6-diaminopimelate ligase